MRSMRMVAVLGAVIVGGLFAVPTSAAAQAGTVTTAPAPRGQVRVYHRGRAWYPRHDARAYGRRYAYPRHVRWYGPRYRHGYRYGYAPRARYRYDRRYYRHYGMPHGMSHRYRGYRGVI